MKWKMSSFILLLTWVLQCAIGMKQSWRQSISDDPYSTNDYSLLLILECPISPPSAPVHQGCWTAARRLSAESRKKKKKLHGALRDKAFAFPRLHTLGETGRIDVGHFHYTIRIKSMCLACCLELHNSASDSYTISLSLSLFPSLPLSPSFPFSNTDTNTVNISQLFIAHKIGCH